MAKRALNNLEKKNLKFLKDLGFSTLITFDNTPHGGYYAEIKELDSTYKLSQIHLFEEKFKNFKFPEIKTL